MEESLAAGLTNNRRQLAVRIGRPLNATADATISIGNEHTSFLVGIGDNEIEQVAIVWSAITSDRPLIADRTSLHRISRRRIDSGPGITAIERSGDVKMPDPLETLARVEVCLSRVVTGLRGADKSKSGAVAISGSNCRVNSILNSKWNAHIGIVLPMQPAIQRDSNVRMAIPILITVVNYAICADTKGWIFETLCFHGTGNDSHGPCKTVIGRDRESLSGSTTPVWYVCGAVWRYFDVAINCATLRRPGWHTRAERQPAVVAASTESRDAFLRTVVNRIWIQRMRRWSWIRVGIVGSRTDGLMI